MRNNMYALFALLLFSFGGKTQTGYMSGHIFIEQIGGPCGLTVEATVLLYSALNPQNLAPDSVLIHWEDGTENRLARINGFQPDPNNPPIGEPISNDAFFNIYAGTHTFPGRDRYFHYVSECCLGNPIVNLANSGEAPVDLWSEYNFLNPQYQGCNNTPVFLQPPIDAGFLGEWLIHNPNAYDDEGDSLSFRFDEEFMSQLDMTGVDISLDERTGEVRFRASEKPGGYVFRLCVSEYRDQTEIAKTCFPTIFHIIGDEFQLFPNPASNILFLGLGPFSGIESFDLKIFDAAGRLVFLEKDVPFQYIYSIDIHDFARAGYVLVFETGERRVVKKFIKM